jgi:hypothetical protein
MAAKDAKNARLSEIRFLQFLHHRQKSIAIAILLQPRAKPDAGFKLCRTETKKEAGPQALKVSNLHELRDLRASFSPFWKTAESAPKCGHARAPRRKARTESTEFTEGF